jgi:LDH2 family malate/lactate/ureidoglycolate dehydrogenase
MIVDILSGIMTGGDFGRHVPSSDEMDSKVSAGFVIQAIDISAFVDPADFMKNMQSMVADIRNSPRAKGVDRLYLPGEIEWIKTQDRLKNGIAVPESLVQKLHQLADELGIQLALPKA